MMSDVFFFVPGEPQGKGRPRFVRQTGRTYTPEKTATYENLVKVQFMAVAQGQRFSDIAQLAMRLRINYSIPKSVSAKKRSNMLLGIEKPVKRPDASNVLKAIEDGLNRVAYRDDAQIVYVEITKRYAEQPGVDVHLWEL